MLNYNRALSDEKSYQDLQIKEVQPTIKLIIRGKKREFFSAVGKSLNMLLPTKPNTSSQGEDLTALWLSPDEWMVYSNKTVRNDTNEYEIEKLLYKNISKLNLGAITDVSDQFILINLKGDKVYNLFESGCPFNFNEFKKKRGSVTQTILAKIDVIIHNQNESDVNLFVRRSFAQHLFSWINDSASRL